MRRMLMLILSAVAFALASPPPAARATPPLEPGARIRWTTKAEPARSIVGSGVSFGSDTLIAEAGGEAASYALPLSSLASLEVSRGHQNKVPRYALIGALSGGLAAVLVVQVAWWTTNETVKDATGVDLSQLETSDETNYAQVALVGAGVGAAIGAAAGALAPGPETWQPVNLAGSPFGAVFSIGAHSAVGVSVRF